MSEFEYLKEVSPALDVERLIAQYDIGDILTKAEAEKAKRSYAYFVQCFWETISNDPLVWNFHMDEVCNRLERIAHRVGRREPNIDDLIINIPPGTTKSILCTIMFQPWCWLHYYWMKFICVSYSSILSLDHAEMSRELIRNQKFKKFFPYLQIKKDKDQKMNFRLEIIGKDGEVRHGGYRFSTSVDGTVTGFHGHIITIDDPLNPQEAESENPRQTAVNWINRTLATRKADKDITTFVLVQQRLHEADPTGDWLERKKGRLDWLCLPGEIENYGEMVHPPELKEKYVNNVLDPKRMSMRVLNNLKEDMGQYGYAGQIGQSPVPLSGGMFKVENFDTIEGLNEDDYRWVRYWDKAGTDKLKNPDAAYTCGVLMGRHKKNKSFVIMDVRRGQWSAGKRESIIEQVAYLDGPKVTVYVEQEPGSGGKESAEATIKNLAGFRVYADKPQGSKVLRADPYASQVEIGNVKLLNGKWNKAFIEEHRYFPLGKFKDQVDATAGAFAQLARKKEAKVWRR